MSGKYNHLGAEGVPAEKGKQIGCLSGFLQLLERAHHLHKSGQKRITAARTPNASPPRTGPKRSSSGGSNRRSPVKSHATDLPGYSQKVSTRAPDFRDVVRDSLNKDRSPKISYVASNNISLPRKSTDSRESSAEKTISDIDSGEFSRFTVFKDSPRFSCDGREISRTPSIVLNRDAVLRCSSLKVRDSLLSPETPSRRSPGLLARLMGLDELPDSACARLNSQASKESERFPDQVPTDAAMFRSESTEQMIKRPDFTAMDALQKRQKLISELESCDRDLQALKKIVEALQNKEARRSCNQSRNLKCKIGGDEVVHAKCATRVCAVKLPASSRIERNVFMQRPERNTSRQQNGDVETVPTHGRRRKETKESSNVSLSFHHSSSKHCPVFVSSNFPGSSREQRKKAGVDFRIEAKVKDNTRESREISTSKNLEKSRVKRCLEFPDDSKINADSESKHTSKTSCNGDDSTELVTEQPSPVSVLDHSSFSDEASPDAERVLQFSENAIEDHDTLKEDQNYKKSEISDWDEHLWKKSSANTPVNNAYILNNQNSDFVFPEPDLNHDYVREIFKASGLLSDGIRKIAIRISSSGSLLPLKLETFEQLEQKYKTEADKTLRNPFLDPAITPNTKTSSFYDLSRLKRRLTFDIVNEILRSKFRTPPWFQASDFLKSGEHILEKVLAEMDKLKSVNEEGEDVCETLMKIMEQDFITRKWNDNSLEMETIVTEVERLIFRDLIDEFLFYVVELPSSSRPFLRRHRRKLYF